MARTAAGRRGRTATMYYGMSQFMAEMEVELENANMLKAAGNITDRFTAFAQAPAFVAPKKHKQGDPLRKQWRLAWDLRQANRQIRSYAWPGPRSRSSSSVSAGQI